MSESKHLEELNNAAYDSQEYLHEAEATQHEEHHEALEHRELETEAHGLGREIGHEIRSIQEEEHKEELDAE